MDPCSTSLSQNVPKEMSPVCQSQFSNAKPTEPPELWIENSECSKDFFDDGHSCSIMARPWLKRRVDVVWFVFPCFSYCFEETSIAQTTHGPTRDCPNQGLRKKVLAANDTDFCHWSRAASAKRSIPFLPSEAWRQKQKSKATQKKKQLWNAGVRPHFEPPLPGHRLVEPFEHIKTCRHLVKFAWNVLKLQAWYVVHNWLLTLAKHSP